MNISPEARKMAPMLQLWLHPCHQLPTKDLTPLKHSGCARNTVGRLRLLDTFMRNGAENLRHTTRDMLQIHLTAHALVVHDQDGVSVLSLPLRCSLMTECLCVAPDSVPHLNTLLGVLAYGCPDSSHAPESNDVWLIVVSCGADAMDTTSQTFMRAAVDTLSRSGAIRLTYRDFELVGKVLGVGGYGTARSFRRRSEADCESGLDLNDLQRSLKRDDVFVAKVLSETIDDHRAIQEVDALLSSQGHPNVLKFLAVLCRDTGAPHTTWVVLTKAYVGGDLVRFIKREGALSSRNTLLMTEDILSALHHIHTRGVIHLDIKPSNVVRDEKGRAVIIDFGCARPLSSTTTGTIRSTIGHVAPEMLNKRQCTPKADVFSCGTVSYFIASGALPFQGSDEHSIRVANKQAEINFSSPSFNIICEGTKQVIRLSLSKSPKRRPSAEAALLLVRQKLLVSRMTASGSFDSPEEHVRETSRNSSVAECSNMTFHVPDGSSTTELRTEVPLFMTHPLGLELTCDKVQSSCDSHLGRIEHARDNFSRIDSAEEVSLNKPMLQAIARNQIDVPFENVCCMQSSESSAQGCAAQV
eukprot:TRINITY_DN5695_c0_g2_i1.p1 TRINITY_DN5695_c0_g2~~TRINITY_DN5695_c0_g2_i1.p1  ORF type:complete len:583 (-),score=49.32 TRINITY_DN5695_c0_g2_i1:199-1947(-)